MNSCETVVEASATQAGCAADLSNQPAAAPSPDRPCWMVVDDDAGILKFLAPILSDIAGVETCCFCSAVEALEAFMKSPHRFQCVVTDLDMPRMSGIALCQRLRTISPDLKVLLITGCGFISRKEALEVGFCGMVAKPFSMNTLERTLEAAGMLDAAFRHLLKTSLNR